MLTAQKSSSGMEAREGNAVVLGKGLHKLESHAAATEFLERVGVVRPLRVERRHGTRQFVVRHVVVTDDEVNAQLLGVCYLLHRLDATVEDDDEFHPRLLRILQSFVADAIPLVVAVGDVIVDVGVELSQKFVHQRDGRASIHVVVAIDQYALLAPHGVVEAVHGEIHVLHQKRVDEIGQLRTKEALGRRLGRDAAIDEQVGEYRADIQLLTQLLGRTLPIGRRRFVIPFEMHLYCSFFDFFFSLP